MNAQWNPGKPTASRKDNGVYALFSMSVRGHRSEGKHLQSNRIAFESIGAFREIPIITFRFFIVSCQLLSNDGGTLDDEENRILVVAVFDSRISS